MSRWRALAFWIVVGVYAIYANWVFANMLPAPIPNEDSGGYLGWSLFRTLGYPAFLSGYDAVTSTWAYFPALQLNLVLACVAALCWATAHVTGSYLLGWLVLAITAGSSRVPLFAAYIMTEGPFAAFLMLHLGGMYLALARDSWRAGFCAGLALAGAVLVKSVGIVLAAPALLLIAFGATARRRTLAIAVLPALLAWFLPSATNLVRHGFFEGSVAGGYALVGHVAWAIHPHPGSPHPELAARIEKRLAPVFARRPAWGGRRDLYVSYTSDEYNVLLWENIVPETVDYLAPRCPGGFGPCTWMRCDAPCATTPNAVMMALARDAILAQPRDYAYHVLAHGERSWRLVFHRPVEFLAGARERATELPHYYRPEVTGVRELLEPVPLFKSREELAALERQMSEQALTGAARLLTMEEAVRTWVVEPLGGAVGRLLPWIALGASLLLLRVRMLSPAALVFCYTGLCLNAYFLGTALFQPALERYSWPMQGATAALLATGVGAAIAAAGNYRRARLIRTEP